MDNYSEILDNAIKKMSGKYEVDHIQYGFNKIYPFTTENISGYLNSLITGSLLTVGSSSDQVLNAILKDTTDINLVDINPYTKFYYYLKLSAILNLSRDEFLNFFTYNDFFDKNKKNSNSFSKDVFEKIKMNLRLLDYESYLFWDDLLQQFNKRIRDCLFTDDEYSIDILKKTNKYLKNNVEYNKLKNKILHSKVSFETKNILEDNFNDTYDNIWLSNIPMYIKEKEKILSLANKFYKLLNNNGILILSYLYDTKINTKYQTNWAPIFDLKNIIDLLKDYNPELLTFDGVEKSIYNKDIKDSVLILRK